MKNKSEVFDMFFNERMDAEFFSKKYLKFEKTILSKTYKRLSEVAFVTDGEHGNAVTFPHGYSKYYGARNATSMILNDNGVEYITQEHHKKLIKTELKPRDVLISCVGANIGCSAIVPDNVGIANIVRNVALIRSINQNVLNEYLHVFFNTKYGKNLYVRMSSGNAQPLVSLDYINTIPVFIPSIRFQLKIKDKTDVALNNLSQSEFLYRQAENLLLKTIGLSDFKPSTRGTNIKSFKESFLATGRLDAEYYQPKYEDYLRLVKNYVDGFDLLQTACNLKDENFTPKETKEYQYIELSDIGKTGNITGCTFAEGSELPTRARRKVSTNDVIISSIEGSLGSCALVTKDYDNAICSTGFYVINSQKINSETLLVLFKSEVMQNILKQGCSGTILTAINKTEFQNIPIPLINVKIQQQIADLIQESFTLRRESEQLLEEAKSLVEREIEE